MGLYRNAVVAGRYHGGYRAGGGDARAFFHAIFVGWAIRWASADTRSGSGWRGGGRPLGRRGLMDLCQV
eukprot:2767516-Lingulodinium_polyedra.AAC.1